MVKVGLIMEDVACVILLKKKKCCCNNHHATQSSLQFDKVGLIMEGRDSHEDDTETSYESNVTVTLV
jgi:hypothetical protein